MRHGPVSYGAISNGNVPIERLLHVVFSRWDVERSFQNEKDQLGLDQLECRRNVAVQRHLIVTAISHPLLHDSAQLRNETVRAEDCCWRQFTCSPSLFCR